MQVGVQRLYKDIIRQDGEDAVAEHLARDDISGIAVHHPAHQQRIERPCQRGGKGERVAYGIEVEDILSVEHHQDRAGKGDERPCHLTARHTL